MHAIIFIWFGNQINQMLTFEINFTLSEKWIWIFSFDRFSVNLMGYSYYCVVLLFFSPHTIGISNIFHIRDIVHTKTNKKQNKEGKTERTSERKIL